MVKWLSGLFDTSDKEITRVRRIVAEANDEIVILLERERDFVAGIREAAFGELAASKAGWQDVQAAEMKLAAQKARSLAGQAESLRSVIVSGEQTSRDLSVLLADAKSLAQMNAEKLQRPPAERHELEQEIEQLVDELGEQLAATMDAKAGLRDYILQQVPKARLHPQRPSAEEMGKQVEAVSQFLGREVADYFGRTNETIDALRRAIALSRLVGLTSSPGAALKGLADDAEAAAVELIQALNAQDLMKHLTRQGLRLPVELKEAAGLVEAQVAQAAGRDRRRGSQPQPAEPDLGPKEPLADDLYWEELATAELLAIAQATVDEGRQPLVAELAEKFAGREEKLQARTALFRARILDERAAYWDGFRQRVEDVAGAGALQPFLDKFAALDAEQEELLARVQAQDENWEAPVLIKPEALADLMQRRDALEDATFTDLTSELRATDSGAADRLRTLYEEFRKEQRKAEQKVLNELIPEAFAVVWEASRRTTGMRPYDVQLLGGIVLHEGRIAEMKTGEGKTLVAVAPLYLNGLAARGAHLVTVNEYLAKRDSDWMGPAYKILGLSVGVILNNMAPWERKAEYMSDITYGTNAELGFDYLRDNISNNPDDVVQRPHAYCIVDEVDNILIDEARTPLIISGASEGSAEVHIRAAQFARTLRPEVDYTVDEKSRSAVLNDDGISRAESFFRVDNLYHPDNFQLVYGVDNALKAHALFKRDKDYVLWQNGHVVSAGERLDPKQEVEVVIVDEFTGRLMHGRRYSEGLHEAIEAKEGIRVQSESQTFATITIQNYFRLYPKLAGMTGTAATEAEEFYKIYKLEVVAVPTHKPMIRIDNPDRIYRTEPAKFNAVLDEIKEMHEQGRPVLVGTVSIEKSEELSKMLEKEGIPHSVLNAKQHEREASIIAQAGQRGAVTIATNMAGRGTDIVLGFGVNEVGGLHIIGTERHESRRIDNQLRGRSGRQGDTGSSRFYVSVEDEIMRRSGVNQNIVNSSLFKSLWDETMPIEHSMVSRSVEQAQVKMEGFNFDTRKHLVEYDDVVNTHRDVIYKERRFILQNGDPRPVIAEMISAKVQELAGGSPGPEDARGKKKAAASGYVDMFQALSAAFPEDVTRRLLRSTINARIAPLAEAGDAEGLAEELKLIATEAHEGVLENQLRKIDDALKEFYHVGDEYYEIAGGGTLDYNKLSRSLGLPLDVINKMREEEMQYEDAQDFLFDLYRTSFERDQRSKLEKLQAHLETEVKRVLPAGGAVLTPEKAEVRTRSFLETIDYNFDLSAATAARYVEAESGRGGGMMAAGADGDIVEELQAQLEELYAEVEETVGGVFTETSAQMPLISMVDTRLPRSVYRQIEERVGAEPLEELENTPLGQLPEPVQAHVKDAFVRWQEADLLMRVIDYLWTRHLTTMESLRHSIGLQAYGQKDPLVQYKVKAYDLFEELKGDIRQLAVLNVLMMGAKAEAARPRPQPVPQPQPQAQRASGTGAQQPARAGSSNGGRDGRQGAQRQGQSQRGGAPVAVAAGAGKTKIGRNDPCFCGSGKKYKHCHGR